MAKSKPSATNFGPDDHKAVGELSLKDHHSKISQSTGNSNHAKNTGFSQKTKFVPIYELVWNQMKSLGGKNLGIGTSSNHLRSKNLGKTKEGEYKNRRTPKCESQE